MSSLANIRISAVKQAAVVAREDEPGDKRLVAHSAAPSVTELREYLKGSLPEYMVPAAIVVLEALPLTVNGKIDRQKLPVPESRPDVAQYVAPATATEKLLSGIWAEVLHVDRVGLQDNFFELGGHSLLALGVVGRIATATDHHMSVRAIFEHPTVQALAKYIELQSLVGTNLPHRNTPIEEGII